MRVWFFRVLFGKFCIFVETSDRGRIKKGDSDRRLWSATLQVSYGETKCIYGLIKLHDLVIS